MELYRLAERYHECGIYVTLKLCLTPFDGMWMGTVDFPTGKQIESVDVDYWGEWFASFTKAEIYFAKLAKTIKADALLIGAEDYSTEEHSDEWRNVIREIRKYYDGPISYEFTYLSCKTRELD